MVGRSQPQTNDYGVQRSTGRHDLVRGRAARSRRLGSVVDEGAASGVQTRARSDFGSRELSCIRSRWLKWKVVFQTGEGRLSDLRVLESRLPRWRAEGRLRLAPKVVFNWP